MNTQVKHQTMTYITPFHKWDPTRFLFLKYVPPYAYKYTTHTINVILLFFTIWFLICLFWWLSGETNDSSPDRRTLQEDGYVVIRNTNKETVLKQLPEGYTFLKYKYIIRGCSLSTFHRDVTSSQYIYSTKHPVYTYIEYTTPANTHTSYPLLTVCPASHTSTPFVYSSPVIISTSSMEGKISNPPIDKTGILFHCDLVHAGAINTLGNTRYAEQYKIAHIDDIDALSHLQNIHMEKNGECDISPYYEYVSRRISWIFSHIANHHFTSYLQTKPDTHIGKMLLSLYGREFYNT
jgi:hypothetical protein